MRHILVDIGNSAVKCALIDNDQSPSEAGVWMSPMVRMDNDTFSADPSSLFLKNDWHDALRDEASDGAVFEWLICSVNRAAVEQVVPRIKLLRRKDKVRAIKWMDLPVSMAVDEPDRVGLDRICAAVGARDLCDTLPGPGRDAIVVDAGTAVTIDLIDKDRSFLGGVIFPGLSMSFKSLHKNTSQLPQVGYESLGKVECAIGKSTQDAIRNGVMMSHVGAISFIVEKLQNERDGRAEVYVTGGDADLIVSHLPSCRHVRELVLRGLATAIEKS